MDIRQAKELVIRAGHELMETGLIVRTWGNVSCRVDAETFAVTPSGLAYETLRPEDIVVVKIADGAYEGELKPSREKGIHALIYRTMPDVGFVIHTHQKYASAAASCGAVSISDPELGEVPVAAYGLPGMKKLARGVEAALAKANGAILMSYHGGLCYGADYKAAFDNAHALERAGERFLERRYLDVSGESAFHKDKMLEFYVQKSAAGTAEIAAPSGIARSRRDGDGMVVTQDGAETRYGAGDTALPREARWHAAVYEARQDVNFIECANDEYTVAVSRTGRPLPPLLDDFAQMMGGAMKPAKTPEDAARVIKKRLGILVPGAGALCCAARESDAAAVKLVTEKTALAEVCARLAGTVKPLGGLDVFLMHLVYTKSYAKKA